MKTGMKYVAEIVAGCIVLAGLFSCTPDRKPDAEFLTGSDLELKVDGSVKVKYVPETFQIGYSSDKKQFRVHNDTMSEYFILTCSELPEKEGQKIKCSLKYTSGGNTVSRTGEEFRVEKIDGSSGTVWLWNSKKKTGVSVMMPE